MAEHSSIEWTEATWNPVTGCDKVSPGCENCYAERLARRLQAMGNPRYANGFAVTLHDDVVDLPLRWRNPRTVFVNSMSDLFHPDVPSEFIKRVFETMTVASHHTFQVLTKRPKRVVALADQLPWGSNVWLGVSVEDQHRAWRIRDLRRIPAAVRFLSCEPLLGDLTVPLDGIGWVIVGGESGPGARPMDIAWARHIRDQCIAADVPFFFKQWGGRTSKAGGRQLDGETWDGMPTAAAAARLEWRRQTKVRTA